MVDVFTVEKRSEIMSKIRSRNTNLETSFLKNLSAVIYPMGYRYRKHYSKLPGKPDIVFVNKKIAVFLDGDFWHGYKFNFQKSRLPKKYWVQKIQNNVIRDKKITKELSKQEWQVLRFWESDIKKDSAKIISKIIKAIS